MTLTTGEIADFLRSVHPYDSFEPEELARTAARFSVLQVARDDQVYALGAPLEGLYLIYQGTVDVRDHRGAKVSLLGCRNSFGERGLMRDGLAATTAYAAEAATLLLLPASEFRRLTGANAGFARFFRRSGTEREDRGQSLATMPVRQILAGPPITCPPHTPILEAARIMRDRNISSLAVVEEDRLTGILTTSDLSNRCLAEGIDPALPIRHIMTTAPVTLSPESLGTDVLHVMHERHIGHLPIVEQDRLVGMVTQTDLTRLQALTSAQFVSDVARARSVAGLAKVTAQIPRLLAQLVGSGNRHDVVTRLITDIADAVTRRLLRLAEDRLGPPPVPYAWCACGSQGRREQTGVSDQDNCLILDDRASPADDAYFAALAEFVCDGLNDCGYVYCPGEMMAVTDRWRQPLKVWQDYFRGWIARPSPEAQMLASVMFDLRPIGGAATLWQQLQAETLRAASENSIFTAHMIANSLKHAPPLGMIRGFATIRSGEYKNRLDLKHNGVVPIADLARVYALQGRLGAQNTRARLEAARDRGVLSKSGAGDLIDAYDLIAQARLDHQAALVRRGETPDNYLAPTELSDFERSHLRDAFVVVRTMQSAIGQGKGMIT
ncbi:DUF294 nucleotidyltransferase-like domain-containing protein [Mangrovicoccus algicola]|uniref:Cyclic nucleotide-binding/CBS domain-containing protein n=1 Tax=Mangrovicoccus algicola TaxID=2771008 RepID=A0A8J7CJ06_9RHOB|nr:DUF294 nucleotidyltransferase-like domain-containing protein [Mangrovicoccus algicola]MBE3637126.1 cyclic nucleotide-binding/CBS domain-containing protein [Mangrovicoccus algicola]